MVGHHLVLGSLEDYLTGKILEDNHDERYRQSIARFLVEQKGFEKNRILPREKIQIAVDEKQAVMKVDFKITLSDRIVMIIQYGPGSLVTRHRPAIALTRLVAPYQVPLAVVTNGEAADILDAGTGAITGSGFDAIPEYKQILQMINDWPFTPISPERKQMESRILFAYEIDDRCPCDDSVCRI